MSNSDLFLGQETGQTCGEQPVHPHDKEVGEDVGDGEVEGDVVRARAGCQGGQGGSVAVGKLLYRHQFSSVPGKNVNDQTHHLPP